MSNNPFNFGPPQQQPQQQPFTPPPQPAQPAPAQFGPQMPFAGGGPGFGPRAPMDAAQAVAGFDADQIETRFPFLPPNFAGQVEVIAAYSKATAYSPYEIYLEVVCRAISNPGGGQEPAPGVWPETANRAPAMVGTNYTLRINGFGGFGDKYARAEMGQCLSALFEDQGVGKSWLADRDAKTRQDAWNQLIRAAFPPNTTPVQSVAVGRHMLVSTSCTIPKRNNRDGSMSKPKLKGTFYGMSVAGRSCVTGL